MKPLLLAFIAIFLISQNNFSQNKQCDCSAALDKSLKDKYTERQMLDLRIELYEYYKFIKNKSDSSKNTFSLSSAGQAYTNYGLFSGSSDTNAENQNNKIENLKKEIEKDQRISEFVFKEIVTDVFSGNQLAAYKACLSSCPKQNGLFYEINGDVNDVFSINLKFTNVIGQPKVTLNQDATLVNCEPIGNYILKDGLEIKNNTSVVQYLKVINKDKPAQIGLSFNEIAFDAIDLSDLYVGISKNLPLGTIINSTLKYSSFLEINRIKPTDNMSMAIWVPCDGRNVRSSKYGEFMGNVPDLRGLFLRNVNDYNDPFDGVAQVKEEQANPENTSAGVFQSDAIKSHNHEYTDRYRHGGASKRPGGHNEVPKHTSNEKKLTEMNAEGKEETRPKNMTVYYYIKIN